MNSTRASNKAIANTSPVGLLFPLLSPGLGTSERTKAIKAVLNASHSRRFREELAEWVLQFVPAEALVPDRYVRWRPLVHDAMRFMLSRLSTERLAPKLAEQIELPLDTKPERRLLSLIAKVPGLQKLGQVLARNRHLPPALRRALAELENGICDVEAEQIRAIIRHQLGSRLEANDVQIEATISFEGSVSAVMRFTWWNADTRRRERAVFKVLKPYIPECFAEDMDLLAQLAKYLGSRHREYGFAPHVLPDTFNDVRRLLQHEVQFTREQATLIKAAELYRGHTDLCIPRVIHALCTSRITAVTEERGIKVTEAVRRMPQWQRAHVTEQLVDALIAVPLFAGKGDALFHADPHAGNLLYDRRTGELTLLDWALTENLTRSERRHLTMLFLTIILRDPVGACDAVEALSARKGRRERSKAQTIRLCVTSFINELPVKRIPGAVDAMNLLERIAFEGIRLPTSLVMFRKALFTLDGILHDIGAPEFSMESVIARHILQNWLTAWKSLGLPLSFRDWMMLQSSALLFPGRLLLQAAQSYVQKKVPPGNPSSMHAPRAKKPGPRPVRRKAVNGNQPGDAGAPVNAAIAEPA
jgi:ubiquinone biosynthesis protein